MSDDPTGEITDIYLPIQLMDVEPGEALDFDTYVFLPTNGKYVIVSRAGEYLDTNKIEKISKNKINKLFIKKQLRIKNSELSRKHPSQLRYNSA